MVLQEERRLSVVVESEAAVSDNLQHAIRHDESIHRKEFAEALHL
jgi:hypothetical protein